MPKAKRTLKDLAQQIVDSPIPQGQADAFVAGQSAIRNPQSAIEAAVQPYTFSRTAVQEFVRPASSEKVRPAIQKSVRQKITIRLETQVIEDMKELARSLGVNLQDVIHAAAVHFRTCPAVQPYTSGAGSTASDDLMIWNTIDDIIELYQNYSNNRWKARDDALGQEFNSTDIRVIEIGIIHTLMNHQQGRHRGDRINSFRYFIPEIRKILDAPFNQDLIDAYLKRRREQWEKTRK